METVKETKFVGILVDNELNWKKHINDTSKKIAKAIGILSKTKQFLNQKTMLQMYYSFIHPYLIYGNVIWGNAPASSLWPIFKLQKIAIRIITNTPRGNSTQPQFKPLRLLRLPDIYTYNTIIFMYKFSHKMMPPSLDSLFIKNKDIHQHNTRGASKLRTPKIRTNMAEKCITTTGVKLWNDYSIKKDPALKIRNFKKKLTTLPISSYHN